MKQALQLRLGQHLTMTPQLQQAIRLLQLSTLELQMEVQQALESNLMLEVEEEQDLPPREGASERINGNDPEDVRPKDIPEELPVDSVWEDIYDAAPPTHAGGDGEFTEFESQRGAVQSLQDYLRWQLEMSNLSVTDAAIAETIVDGINDDGYLSLPIEEIHAIVTQGGVEIDLDEVAAVLHQVQSLDPPGIAARDLRECLLIQLSQLAESTPWRGEAIGLVRDHLALLATHDHSQLVRRVGLSKENLPDVIELIRGLNPHPGAHISSAPSQYLVPDVFVRKKTGGWVVELNPEVSPKLRINSEYARLIRRADNSESNNCLKIHLQEARWFLKSLRSRSETLLKVSTCIVERQRMFLEHGEEAMKPMVLHDVAEIVDMHESTISRVTTQKFMHTPRGIFELKYFFSSHVSTASGGEASSTAIRALIKKLIAAENPRKPLSDSKLAGILCEQGVNVARRTVAKYREAMTIPSSSDRRRLV